MDFLPARWVPLLYLALAHVCLATAFVIVAADPGGIAGFYYHPRLVAIVHLVTLGFISGSILGSLYLVGPLVFRLPLQAGRADYAAFVSFAVGVTGMVTHFWLGTLSGMAWAAGLVFLALAFVGSRVVHGLLRAPVPGEARLPVALAFLNILAAAGVGILLGINRTHPFLPSSQLQIVHGHAHLALLGWAVMMVMGVGYRLLPMILPAAMPRGRWPYTGTLLTQAGAAGLFVGLSGCERWILPAAVAAAAGIAVFFSQIVWMARHRRPAPSERPRPDLPVGHVIAALGSLALAAAIGVGLAARPPSDESLRWVMAYGVLGLVGFLSQMIIGVASRLVPLYAWLWGFADTGHQVLPPSLHRAASRTVQALVLFAWALGAPLLATALAFEWLELMRVAAVALAASVLLAAFNLGLVLRRLWRPQPPAGEPVQP